jgi:GT2 family glycosyltransferase
VTINAPNLRDVLTLSIVSHGHGALLDALLHDLDLLPSIAGCRTVVTLNVAGESFDRDGIHNLDVDVLENASPKGFGANHNAAFRRCQTPWFAILNPDLRIRDDPFPPLLPSEPRADLVAPRVVNSQGEVEDSVRTNLTPLSLARRHLLGDRTRPDTSAPARAAGPFYWLGGMFLIVRSSAFARVGGFDERYYMYCEDYDLCARLYLAGSSLRVDETVQVIHDSPRASRRSGWHLRRHVAGLIRTWCSRPVWSITMGGAHRLEARAPTVTSDRATEEGRRSLRRGP